MGKIESIQRYLIIIRKIRSKVYITLKDLLQEVLDEMTAHGNNEFRVSERSLKRDIEELRWDFKIPIEYTKNKGYHFPQDEEFPAENIESVLESFDILNVLNADTGMNHIVYPERRNYRGTEYLYPLLKATQKKCPVTFSYQKYGSDTAFTLKVYPYALKQCKNRWYLLGIKEGEEILKSFGLDRLRDIKILSGKFKPNPDIDIKAKYKDLFGIVDDPEVPVEEVILSFDHDDGKYVESLPIHHSQERLPSYEDRYVIRLRLKITYDFILEILSRGTSLQVISPEYLRKEIYWIHKNGMDINPNSLPSET